MATQISKPKLRPIMQLDEKIPSTMRAVVYRGINDMRLETVPVPQIGPGELHGSACTQPVFHQSKQVPRPHRLA